MKYKLKKLIKNVYIVELDNSYDLAMLFLRYQEFYESPNPKIRKCKFTILDYMEWYSKANNKDFPHFSYPKDYAGYNIPANLIPHVQDEVGIEDPNKYDKEIRKIFSKLGKEPSKSYLIGSLKGDNSVKMHELAHGMFFVDQEYKQEMLGQIKKLNKDAVKVLKVALKQIGYAKEVFEDEMQAYMATGLNSRMIEPVVQKETPQFKAIFKKYCKKHKVKHIEGKDD